MKPENAVEHAQDNIMQMIQLINVFKYAHLYQIITG